MLEGRCACGALVVTADRPTLCWTCHCRGCQRESGSGSTTWVAMAEGRVDGPHTLHAGSHGARHVCPTCGGSPLCRDEGRWLVPLTMLDDAGTLRPQLHTAVEEQCGWDKPWDGAPRVEGRALPTPLPEGWRPARDGSLDRQSPLTMRPVDDDNRMAVLSQAVSGPQMRFVAPNVMSLLEQQLCRHETWLRAIHVGDVAVGLCLVDLDDSDEEDENGVSLHGQPFLWRFLIDEHYQGLGYGRRAIQHLVEAMRERGAHTLYVSCGQGAGSPMGFYEAMGFRDTGHLTEGENILAMPLTDASRLDP